MKQQENTGPQRATRPGDVGTTSDDAKDPVEQLKALTQELIASKQQNAELRSANTSLEITVRTLSRLVPLANINVGP